MSSVSLSETNFKQLPYTGAYDRQVEALAPLMDRSQWVGYQRIAESGKPKPRKLPFNPKSSIHQPRQASVTIPSTWGTYAQAVAFAGAAQMDGIGIVLTRNLGLTLIDLDDCLDVNGKIKPWAAAIVAQLNSYTEYSPSGRGLHILVWGTVVALKTNRVEIYSTERYTTITGQTYGPVRPIRQAQAELEALRGKYAPPAPVEKKPAALPPVDAGDAAVIEVLCRNPKQAARWAGRVTGNRSSHLFGLINGLIWLCGSDPIRIIRLLRHSGLYDPKRHEQNSGGGHSNLEVSVFNAIATWTGTPYKWSTPDPPQPTTGVTVTPVKPLLTELLEEKHPPPRPFVESELRILLGWLFCGGLAVMLRSRTHDTTMAVAATIIEVAIERQRLDSLSIGLEEIRRRAGLGSTSTVRAALKRLDWLITHIADGDKITKADQYSFNLTTLDWALDLAHTPDSLTCSKSHEENNLPEMIMRFGANETVYTAHMADDIFSTGGGGDRLHLRQPDAWRG